jgi:hypothetical protein
LSPLKARQQVKAILRLVAHVPYRPVGTVGNWHWCEDHICKFESWCLNTFFNECVEIAQICLLIKIVHLLYYLTCKHNLRTMPSGLWWNISNQPKHAFIFVLLSEVSEKSLTLEDGCLLGCSATTQKTAIFVLTAVRISNATH